MNYNRIQSLLLSGSIILFGITAHAQGTLPATDSKLTPNTPGNNPSIGSITSPALFSGTANIRIPIYEYNTDAGNFGVVLRYNTKGVKVDELSTPAGLHWNLQAGGTITRVIKDIPDETWIVNQPSGSPTAVGKFYVLNNTLIPGGGPVDYLDGESDDFLVSAGGLSFAFNIGKDGFVFTHPHRNITIQFTINGVPVNDITSATGVTYDNIGFKIKDEGGNQYWFRDGGHMKQYMYDGQPQPDTTLILPYISQWVISKVVLANGNELKFTYRTSELRSGQPLYKAFTEVESPYVTGYNLQSRDILEEEQSENYLIIDSIYYPDHVSISFLYADSNEIPCRAVHRDIIKEIKISSGDHCVRYRLNQAYSVAPFAAYPNIPREFSLYSICSYNEDNNGNPIPDFDLHLRRILKGIDILSCDGTYTEPYYTFQYDTLPLPPRLSGSQDYFGYYNGETVTQSNGQLTVPFHHTFHGDAYVGVYRNYDADFAKAGILTSVKNAYGGSVSFEYDATNTAGIISQSDIPGYPGFSDPLFMGFSNYNDDGVALKKIIQSDTFYSGNYKQTVFTYSGGQQFLVGGYFHLPCLAGGGEDQYAFNGIFVSPHQFIDGSNHGYSQVTIENKDQSGQLLSKRDITFSNFEDALSNNKPKYLLVGGTKNYFDQPFSDKQYIKDWEIGLPLVITDYDRNGRILSQTINNYHFELDTVSTTGKFDNIHSLKAPDVYANPGDDLVTVSTDTYRPYTGKAMLIQRIRKNYASDEDRVQDTLSFTYDLYDNLETISERDSRGNQIITHYIYNYDVSGPGVPYGNQTGSALYNMTEDKLEKVVSIERWKPDVSQDFFNDKLFNAEITGYRYANGQLLNKAIYRLTTGSPVTFEDYTGMVPNGPPMSRYRQILTAYNTTDPVPYHHEISEVSLFDLKGNPLETRFLDQDVYNAAIWDTVSLHKLAEARNARFADIAYSSFEGSLYNSNLSVNKLDLVPGGVSGKQALSLWTLMSPGTAITVTGTQDLQAGKKYTLSVWIKGAVPNVYNGVTPVIMPGLPVYTLGDWKNYIVQITGTGAKVKIAGTAASSYIDEVRLFPSDAQMLSRTYEPLYGVSSSTDASGRITYYEYDALGRPKLTRDQEGHIRSLATFNVAQ